MRLAMLTGAGSGLSMLLAVACGTQLRATSTALPAAPPTAPSRSAGPGDESGLLRALHGECSSDGWCWENPLPLGEVARAVWGARSGSFGELPPVPGPVAAAGVGDDGVPWVASSRGMVWRLEGGAWAQQAPDSCQAMGCTGPSFRTASGGTFVRRPGGSYWDGTALVEAMPDPRGRRFGGARESRVLLVSGVTGGYVTAWNGSGWTKLPALYAGAAGGQHVVPRSIWGITDDDFWVVGKNGVILHGDGARWQQFASGTDSDLTDVWGTAHDDVWAVGAAALLHWNGTAWQNAVTSVSSAALHAVWATDEEAWAVGDDGTILRRGRVGWTRFPSGVTANLRGVGGTSARDVWVVGDGGTVLHFDGERLAPVQLQTAVTRAVHDVWPAAPDDVWFVGAGGLLLHFDGQRVVANPSPVSRDLYRVRGVAADRIVAVGDATTVIGWDGRAWTQRRGPTCMGSSGGADRLTGLWFGGDSEWWVTCRFAGPRRNVLGAWLAGSSSGEFHDVLGVGSELWVVGRGERARRDASGTWTRSDGVTLPLHALAASPGGRLFAVGEGGTILSRDPRATRHDD